MDEIVYILINYQDFAKSFILMENKGIIKEHSGIGKKGKIFYYGKGYADALGLNCEIIEIYGYDDMKKHMDFFEKFHYLRLYNSVLDDILRNV